MKPRRAKFNFNLLKGVKKMTKLRPCDIEEIREFIIGSNLEIALINQCCKESKPIFNEWLGLSEED